MKKTKSATITALLTIAVIAGVPALAITKAAPALDLPQPETAIQTDIEEVTGKPVVAQGLSMQEAKEIAAAGKAAAQEQATKRAEWLATLEKKAKETSKEEKTAEDKVKDTEDKDKQEESKVEFTDSNKSTSSDGKSQSNTSANQQSNSASQTQSQSNSQSQTPKHNNPSVQPSKPAQHVHSPATRWVSKPEQKWVVDQPAWDEEKWTTYCGFYDGVVMQCSDPASYRRQEELLLAGKPANVSQWEEVEVIHHEEQGHWETVDNGWEETYCSSCGTIL